MLRKCHFSSVAQGTLLNVFRAAWIRRGVGENGHMYMCGWVPSLFTWETTTVLLIGCSPIQKKFSVKKENSAIFVCKCTFRCVHKNRKGLEGGTRMGVRQTLRWELVPDTYYNKCFFTISIYCFWNLKELKRKQQKTRKLLSKENFMLLNQDAREGAFPTVVCILSIPTPTKY